jgi:hypothetical protein
MSNSVTKECQRRAASMLRSAHEVQLVAKFAVVVAMDLARSDRLDYP